MTKTISKLSTCAFLFCALAGTAHGQAVDLGPAAEPLEFEYSGQLIEVAIALDTSGSMKSLRDAARLKLWEIVQETALLEPAPTLRAELLSTSGNQFWRDLRGLGHRDPAARFGKQFRLEALDRSDE